MEIGGEYHMEKKIVLILHVNKFMTKYYLISEYVNF